MAKFSFSQSARTGVAAGTMLDHGPELRPWTGARTLTDQSLLDKPARSSDSLEPAKPLHQLAFGDADYAKPAPVDAPTSWYGRTWAWLIRSENVEAHGVGPLKEDLRTDARFPSNFTLWLTMNATIACFSTGTLGASRQ